jgi:hypothetical protein
VTTSSTRMPRLVTRFTARSSREKLYCGLFGSRGSKPLGIVLDLSWGATVPQIAWMRTTSTPSFFHASTAAVAWASEPLSSRRSSAIPMSIERAA